jgi:predicted dehydrogenase
MSRPTSTSRQLHRRDFLKGALALSAFPWIATSRRGWAAPNERVNLACCGLGARGAAIIKELDKTGLANVVALCDVDMGGPQTAGILKKFPDLPRFKDFREMFDKMGGQIDAVSVGVPDHSHFPMSMLAMSLGKHVFCEKPMARTYRETALMMAAEAKYKVAAQMGNQGHSGANHFQFKAWAEAGVIKNVTRIDVHMNSPRRWHGWTVDAFPPEEPIPATLDWDRWLATAQHHAFSSKFVQGNWRCWYDFGNGALGDWGAHLLDTAHRFLDLGLPDTVTPVQLDGHNTFIFPQASTLRFDFPARGSQPPVAVTWYDGQKNLPPKPDGYGDPVYSQDVPPPSSGKLEAAMPPGKIIYGEGLTFKGGSHSSTLKIIPADKAKDLEPTLPKYPGGQSNHFKNFLLACKGQEKCRSPFAVAGPLCQALALGVIAQRVNAKLAFDRATQKITNHEVANALLDGPPPRKGWEEFYKL